MSTVAYRTGKRAIQFLRATMADNEEALAQLDVVEWTLDAQFRQIVATPVRVAQHKEISHAHAL